MSESIHKRVEEVDSVISVEDSEIGASNFAMAANSMQVDVRLRWYFRPWSLLESYKKGIVMFNVCFRLT